MAAGSVVIVGAGPGDPELITRKGWHAIGSADVVLHDALLDLDGFREAAPQARWIHVGKRAGSASTEQNFINRMLVNLARRGHRVVRLKGGDPAIFGRLTEELDACNEAGIDVSIIPGVTAASASAADLGLSLTQRGRSRSVVFLTPRIGRGEVAGQASWVRAALAADTVVLYMARDDIRHIAATLIQHGRSPQTPVALVANASRDSVARFTDLAGAADCIVALGNGPVTIVMGEIASAGGTSFLQSRFEEHTSMTQPLQGRS
jgi:uroporphyrin-III C-methyltransferase